MSSPFVNSAAIHFVEVTDRATRQSLRQLIGPISAGGSPRSWNGVQRVEIGHGADEAVLRVSYRSLNHKGSFETFTFPVAYGPTGVPVAVLTKPGGLYVRLDDDTAAHLRERLEQSQPQMAHGAKQSTVSFHAASLPEYLRAHDEGVFVAGAGLTVVPCTTARLAAMGRSLSERLGALDGQVLSCADMELAFAEQCTNAGPLVDDDPELIALRNDITSFYAQLAARAEVAMGDADLRMALVVQPQHKTLRMDDMLSVSEAIAVGRTLFEAEVERFGASPAGDGDISTAQLSKTLLEPFRPRVPTLCAPTMLG